MGQPIPGLFVVDERGVENTEIVEDKSTERCELIGSLGFSRMETGIHQRQGKKRCTWMFSRQTLSFLEAGSTGGQ